MRWDYVIEWMNGERETIRSNRFQHIQTDAKNLIIEVNEHGHDRRHDQIVIPLVNVRRCYVKEVL